MKKGVTAMEVFDFKENWCDENQIIPKLLSTQAMEYLIEPILDVGCGLGDIAYLAFPEKIATCIDVNQISPDEFPLSPNHERIQIDFFEFCSDRHFNTVLISHTLQFLDDDVDRLNKAIHKLNPTTIILVLNDNNDLMGDIVDWAEKNLRYSNPEKHVHGFPEGYSIKKTIPFEATIHCPDFKKLVKQVGYLIVQDLIGKDEQLTNFLKIKLAGKPQFTFKQSILIYQKDGK